ncbi:MAG TPA: PEGA domain-containing protein [Gemmatimonadaceae bacterium]|nr:PEGA domain-containing protein [Gemmatimonadaceae bacterium]
MRKVLGILAGSAIVASCGAIFNSGAARVNFTSTPDNAEVWIDGVRRGTTPVFLELEKKKDHTITFKKAGYQDMTNPLPRSIRGVYVVFDVLGGLLPVIVDAATGSWYVLSTDHVHGSLQQTTGQLTPDQLKRFLAGEPLSHFVPVETLTAR